MYAVDTVWLLCGGTDAEDIGVLSLSGIILTTLMAFDTGIGFTGNASPDNMRIGPSRSDRTPFEI